MRYLKSFNENLDTLELKDFCETNLAYLMDEGFEVSIDERFSNMKRSNYGSGFYIIIIEDNNKRFTWDEIKDSFIPFMHLLKSSYILREWGNQAIGKSVRISFDTNSKSWGEEVYSLDQILNDQIEVDSKIKDINIIIDTDKL